MTSRLLLAATVLGALLAGPGRAFAAEPPVPAAGVALSAGTLNLLREEMREISAGMQGLALAIASADWQAIHETSARIRESYIMERRLTPAQARELDSALPARFRMLDADFHARADRLGAAAAARDAELAVFHYSRLLESCTVCHAEFARARFPGFAPEDTGTHRH